MIKNLLKTPLSKVYALVLVGLLIGSVSTVGAHQKPTAVKNNIPTVISSPSAMPTPTVYQIDYRIVGRQIKVMYPDDVAADGKAYSSFSDEEIGRLYVNKYQTTELPTPNSEKRIKYNPFNSKWEYATNDEHIRYNAMEDNWEYASDDERTRYDVMENEWEFARDDEQIKYNAMEDTWQYAPSDSETRYNIMEDRWEVTNSNANLKYNAMEDEWSYE